MTNKNNQTLHFYLMSLGCAKNLVDAECMSQSLRMDNLISVARPEDADILILNTCGFIEPAKKESIDAILDLASYKKPAGRARFLIVTGCLSQRYGASFPSELPEVDAVLGTGEYGQINALIKRLYHGADPFQIPGAAGSIEHLKIERQPATEYYAYIKIAEGCSKRCSFCAIPDIRGPQRSRPLAEIVAEARRLSRSGYGELILIAQDSGAYGLDLNGQRQLPQLLTALCQIEDVRAVRVLYTYASGLSDELIEVMKREEKICRYLDVPIQHASDRILQLMNRSDSRESLYQLFFRLREQIPGLIIRTTVLVGFPGEEESDFDQLLSFIKEVKFDRLGCFVYSPEEGTRAFDLPDQVPLPVATRRFNRVMQTQQVIAEGLARKRIDQIMPVLLETVEESGIFYVGRSYGEAPDVDPVIYVAATDETVQPGQVRQVRIVDAKATKLMGVTVP